MKNEQKIREAIMRRVYALYVVRLVLSPAVRIAVLGSSIGLVTLSISIPNVINNMPSFLDIASTSQFFIYAFLNTQMAVQALLVIVAGVIGWTGVDLARVVTRKSHRFDTALN